MIGRSIFWIASLLLAVPVTAWGWFHERRILRHGRELIPSEIEDARAAGVHAPEKIRVLAVEHVPNPLGPLFIQVDRWTRIGVFNPGGLTLRYGIFAVPPLDTDRELLVHEFVHTAQYERLGGVARFLRHYIFQCLAHGYLEAPLEVEACERSARICGAQS